MARLTWVACLSFGITIAACAHTAAADQQVTDRGPASEMTAACDPGTALTSQERADLLASLSRSRLGQEVLADYLREYGSYANLLIQWDGVSYSQVVTVKREAGRAPAGLSKLGNGVCVHLTKKLPEIEHIADLAHELTHATRLSLSVLRGDVDTVEEFVHARLAARGGEAEAFSVECRVKREILGHWDDFCAPYASSDDESSFDIERVIHDFYSGRLSASLTGETYPIMLGRQYRAMTAKKVAKTARVSYAQPPYAGP